ncbi:hypothetical protein Dd586_0848 [Dickeya parazeae Ech586]|uniref:Uncharacterized protein n=1 Tax=Dickeya zeae (strain Ech586) TaxID=590409 RepID=D2BT99_DICZ5|nr:hypothetical protein Dd586_0848 [Dickeya parazeae Ech586]
MIAAFLFSSGMSLVMLMYKFLGYCVMAGRSVNTHVLLLSLKWLIDRQDV